MQFIVLSNSQCADSVGISSLIQEIKLQLWLESQHYVAEKQRGINTQRLTHLLSLSLLRVKNLHAIMLTSEFWSQNFVPWSHNPPGTCRHELAFVRYIPELIAREMGQWQSLIEFTAWKVVQPSRSVGATEENTSLKKASWHPVCRS